MAEINKKASNFPKQGDMNMSQIQSIPHQGEVWLVNFKKIKETSKPYRPCLVISNNEQNEFDEEVILVPLTTQEVIVGEIQFFEVLIENSQKAGLDEPSRILLNRIHTVDKNLRLVKKLGQVDSKTWVRVWKALWIVFTGRKLD